MTSGPTPTIESEITWLLHRAAQHMHHVTGQYAEDHGVSLRDHIVLSALEKTPGQTQVELAKTIGLDKTTLMSQLDRLEHQGLIVRHPDPRDRRARIPEITCAGNTLRAAIADTSAAAERDVLADFTTAEIALFRTILFTIIGDSSDPGSCI